MSILVTGGAGFIGAHVAQALVARGEKVVILDDFNDRYDPRLKKARMENMFLGMDQPIVIEGDIRGRDLLEHLFVEHDIKAVIHLAAWASVLPSMENPYIYTEVNVDGTVNLLEVAARHKINNFVFASTSSVYGGLTHIPFSETDDTSRPLSPYAATKVAGETMCATWYNMYGLPVTCLRFFTVYGPWGRPEMAMFKFARAILHGEPVYMRGRLTQRDFTYIDDNVQGIIKALDKPQGFGVYNLGENDGVPLPRLIAALENELGKKAIIEEVPLPKGDIARTLANISKAKQDLDYNPTTTLEAGIKKFVTWYLGWYVPNFE